jgi:hypothetical protein
MKIVKMMLLLVVIVLAQALRRKNKNTEPNKTYCDDIKMTSTQQSECRGLCKDQVCAMFTWEAKIGHTGTCYCKTPKSKK